MVTPAIFLKQRRRNHIYPLIGGLRGENCRYKQLQRVTKIQLAMRIGINLRPGFDQLFHPLTRSHTLLITDIVSIVILNEVKDLTIDDRSCDEFHVSNPSIVRSLASLGMTD